MNWSYRVVHELVDGEDCYDIRECYFDDAGVLETWSIAPVEPFGQSLEELESDLRMMLDALNKGVLEMDALPKGGVS